MYVYWSGKLVYDFLFVFFYESSIFDGLSIVVEIKFDVNFCVV